jgi:oligoribonuclease
VRPSKPINLQDVDPFVWKMHRASGLWGHSLASELNLAQAANLAVKLIIDWKAQGSPMCGNTISFDRNFLKAQAPELLRALHYRSIDVSTLKNVMAVHFPDVAPFEKPREGAHRVGVDIDNSIAEYRHYISLMTRGVYEP